MNAFPATAALSRLTSAAVTGGPGSYRESYGYSATTGSLESKGGRMRESDTGAPYSECTSHPAGGEGAMNTAPLRGREARSGYSI
jgi:hypothetical protein